jgi:hypothetical protein
MQIIAPASGSFASPAPLAPPASQISSPAVLARPSTERVLGSFRDVTSQSPPSELEVRPRSSFGAASEQSDLPPSLPPR